MGVQLLSDPHQQAAIDAFLERDMRHQKVSPEAVEGDDLSRIAFGIHAAYSKLSRGEPNAPVRDELDRLRAEFDKLMVHSERS